MRKQLPHAFAGLLCVAAVLACVVALAGCSSPSSGAVPPPTGDAASQLRASGQASENGSGGAGAASADQQAQDSSGGTLHTSTYKPNGKEIAVVKTNKGTFEFSFFPKDAPNTVATFIELSLKGFYDGILFHRVVPNFVVQAGDPQTKDPNADPQAFGTGGPGFNLKAEFNKRKHLEGTVAMAHNAVDPNSAGSQFYVCLSPQPRLDGQYTVFGQVTKGMDVVKKIQIGDKIESITILHANK